MILRRLPTQYSQHRAASGRLASGTDDTELEKRAKRSQLQNVPKKLRDTVVALPDHVMVGGDFAGIEWAIAIWYAAKMIPRNRAYHLDLLDRFWEGKLDPHRFLAAEAFGVPESRVTSLQRRTCKAYTHGRSFGGSPQGLAIEVGHPIATGHRVCAAHDAVFKLEEWQSRMALELRRCRYVQTPLGWRRYFFGIKPRLHEVLGTLVQATAADLCKWVLLDMFRARLPWIEILTTTHDSYLLQVPLSEAGEGKKWLKDKMEQPIPWLDNRRWRADVKVGGTWRDVS